MMRISRLSMRVLIVLLTMQAGAFAQDRKVKPGDVIEVVVYGHTELSRVVTVSPQGTIDFPFMQSLPVDGLTLERLREIIIAQLSRYLNTYPVVTISFAKSNTINISVLGMVRNPGVVQIPLNSTLQGAVGTAGGFAAGARMNEVTLLRNDEGKVRSGTYDIERFILEGDLQQNPLLQEGDVVMVKGNPMFSKIKVIGSVRSPGVYDSFSGANILDMILQAGGPTEDANLSKVSLVSPLRKTNAEIKIDIKGLLTSDDYAQIPTVKPGDVIYIPKKKQIWRAFVSAIRDMATLALAIYWIDRIKDR